MKKSSGAAVSASVDVKDTASATVTTTTTTQRGNTSESKQSRSSRPSGKSSQSRPSRSRKTNKTRSSAKSDNSSEKTLRSEVEPKVEKKTKVKPPRASKVTKKETSDSPFALGTSEDSFDPFLIGKDE